MTIKIYGIKNCDTMKKAFKWLEQHNLAYEFHDYRKDGIDADFVRQAFASLDWQQVVNKRGTTFRQLDDEVKANLSADNAVALLVEQPAMIKRPILNVDGNLHLGFKADQYQQIFGH